MGKTADLTVEQKMIIDALHKEGKPQKVIAEKAGCSQSSVSKHIHGKKTGRGKCGRKRCTSNGDDRSLETIVRQSQFKNLVELHKEWSEAGARASRATTYRRLQEMGYTYCVPSVEEARADSKPEAGKIKELDEDVGEENVTNPRGDVLKEESIEVTPEQHLRQELDWCIEQLELQMKVQKSSTKQRKEACRALKTLRSSKASMVEKRQVMRAVSKEYYEKAEKEKERRSKRLRSETNSPDSSVRCERKSSGSCAQRRCCEC